MADQPFPLTATTLTEIIRQTQKLFEDLYEDRIGGALLGDVFEIDAADYLSLKVAGAGGLEKSASHLQIKNAPTGGLYSSAGGEAVKCKPGGGVSSDAAGVYINPVGGASFAIINCPSGSDPTADMVGDTLNLVAGTGITITGDSVTDSVTITGHTRLHTVTEALDHSFPGGTLNFLRSDGSWQAPPSGSSWGNLDNGHPNSTFGGVSPIDCGGVV